MYERLLPARRAGGGRHRRGDRRGDPVAVVTRPAGTAMAKSHAAPRLAERFGIALSKKEFGALIERVRAGAGVLLDKRPDAERRLLNVQGKDVVILWNPIGSWIVSILPVKRKLPRIRMRKRGKDGKSKSEGRRPDAAKEME
jgi:hypothetical protein